MKRAIVSGVVAAATVAWAGAAEARVVQDERYSCDIAWNAAIRLLHVDFGFAINERDRDAGFVLFTWRDPSHSSPGSMELVRSRVDGVDGCRIIVQLSQMPNYAERLITSRLARKLRDEYGEPPARRTDGRTQDRPTAPPPSGTNGNAVGSGNGGSGNGGSGGNGSGGGSGGGNGGSGGNGGNGSGGNGSHGNGGNGGGGGNDGSPRPGDNTGPQTSPSAFPLPSGR